MKVIAGLGNPEKKYEKTYHNLGFLAADNVAKKLNLDYREKSDMRCFMAQGFSSSGEKFLLIKPTTYMNLSGECISRIVSYYNLPLKDLLVIYDDLDIDIGKIRFRAHGKSGTHNGVRNITALLGSEEFNRVRIGSKQIHGDLPIVDYVLSEIPECEYESLNFSISRAADLAIDFINGDDKDILMQRYNGNAEGKQA